MSNLHDASYGSQPLAKSQAVLSAAWRPVREQKSFYAGGKIVNSPVLGNALVGMHDEDLHIFRPPHMKHTGSSISSTTARSDTSNDLSNTLCTQATLSGENDGILCFAVNPKSGEIVTSHRSTLVKYWDVTDISSGGDGSGDAKAGTTAAESGNNATAESDDINALATASQVKPAFQFRETKAWRPHQDVVSDLDFDDKGNYLASAGLDKAVRVWDSRGHFCTHNFGGFQGLVSLLKFVPGKMWIVAVGEDGEVRILDMHSSSCIAVLKDHLSQVTCVDFFNSKFCGGVAPASSADLSSSDQPQMIDVHAEADTLVTGGRDSVINVWRLNRDYEHQKKQKKGEAKQQGQKNSGPAVKLVKTIPVYESVEGVACVPSKANNPANNNCDLYTPEVVTAGEKGLLKWWNPTTGRNVATQPSMHATKGSVRACFMVTSSSTTQGNQLVSCGEDNGVIYRDLQAVRAYAGEGSSTTSGEAGKNSSNSSECLARYMGHSQEILAAQFLDSQGTKILCATGDEHAKIVDSRTFNVVTPLIGHEESVLCIGGSKSSSIVGTGSKDNTIRLWHSESGKCLAVLQGHGHSVSCITFPKKDQKHFISASIDKTIKIWEILEADLKKGVVKATAVVTRVAHEKDINCVQIAPSEKLFASGSQDKTVKIWSHPTGELMGELKGHRRGIWNVAFSPVAKLVATASGDCTMRLWNLADYTAIKSFEGHTGAVLDLRFLPNGMQLMSSGSDGLCKLWNIRTTDCVQTMDEHDYKIWALDTLNLAAKKGGQEEAKRFMITGAEKLSFWADVTDQVTQEKLEQESEKSVQQIKIHGLVQAQRYGEALTLCLKLNRIGQMRTIFERVGVQRMEETLVQKTEKEKEKSRRKAAVERGNKGPQEVDPAKIKAAEDKAKEERKKQEKQVDNSSDEEESAEKPEGDAKKPDGESEKAGGEDTDSADARVVTDADKGENLRVAPEGAHNNSESQEEEEDDDDGVFNVDQWLLSLSDKQLGSLISEVIAKWNTNTKTASLASVLLNRILLKVGTFEALCERIPALSTSIASSISTYGIRHQDRWQGLLQKTYMIDLLLQSSGTALPQQINVGDSATSTTVGVSDSADKTTHDVLFEKGAESDSENDSAEDDDAGSTTADEDQNVDSTNTGMTGRTRKRGRHEVDGVNEDDITGGNSDGEMVMPDTNGFSRSKKKARMEQEVRQKKTERNQRKKAARAKKAEKNKKAKQANRKKDKGEA